MTVQPSRYEPRRLATEIHHDFPVVYPIVFGPLFVLFLLYISSTIVLFFYFAKRRKDQSLVERSLLLTALETGFGTIYGTNAFLRTGLPYYPCFLDIWMIYLTYSSWALVVTLAMLRYYMMAEAQQVLAAGIRSLPVTPDNLDQHLANLLKICSNDPWTQTDGQDNCVPQIVFENTPSDPDSKIACPPSDNVDEAVESLQPIGGCSAGPVVNEAESPGIEVLRPSHSESICEVAPFADALFPPAIPNNNGTQQQHHTHTDQPVQARESHRVNFLPGRGRRQSSCRRQQGNSRRSSLISVNKAKWLRRLRSDRFLTYTVLIALIIVFIVLVFLTIFSSIMSLRRVHFNCNRGWEYYPIMAFTLFLCAIIFPIFLVVTWSHKDGYGIRVSLAASSVVGSLSWIGAIVWRSVPTSADYYISTSLFFLVQVVCVHTCVVTYPVIRSLKFSKKQRAGTRDTERVHEYGRVLALDAPQTEYDLSKQSFLCAMRDSTEHQKIKSFAMTCFCSELISFLDVYLALKSSVYFDIQRNGIASPTSASTIEGGAARRVSEGSSSSPVQSNERQSVDRLPLLPEAVYNQSASTEPTEDNLVQFSLNTDQLPAVARDSRTLRKRLSDIMNSSVIRKVISNRRESAGGSGSPDTRVADPDTKDTLQSRDLGSLLIGIAQNMQEAFPELCISEATLFPERLRSTINMIIRAFMLPSSPLAINAPSPIVARCKNYLDGDPLSFSLFDQVKDEVVDMLYSNVYLRYRRS